MRSDETGWRFHADLSNSHSIHAHGETGHDAMQFWLFQAIRSAWIMSFHFPDDGWPNWIWILIPV